MKKRLTAIIAGVMAVTVLAAGCSSSSGSVDKIRLATGGTSGTYYAFGGVVGQALSEATDIAFDVQSTGASKANIGLVADGEVDMAIVQNDVMDYAYNGTDLINGSMLC